MPPPKPPPKLAQKNPTETPQILPEPNPSSAPKGLDLYTMQLLRSSGCSYGDIGRKMGCTKANVIERLKPYKAMLENPKLFRDGMGDMIETKMNLFLAGLTTDLVKDMSGAQKTLAFCQLFDKVRLLKNESTMNLDVHAECTNNIKDIQAEIARLSSAPLTEDVVMDINSEVEEVSLSKEDEVNLRDAVDLEIGLQAGKAVVC